MATLTIRRAKKLIASGLNDKLNYMALYQEGTPIYPGSVYDLRTTDYKSDNSPYFVELNKQLDLPQYKAVNDFSQIEWDGEIGLVVGLNRIMNFFIDRNNTVSKILITDGIGSSANITASVSFPAITPTNDEDENFLINVFEILID